MFRQSVIGAIAGMAVIAAVVLASTPGAAKGRGGGGRGGGGHSGGGHSGGGHGSHGARSVGGYGGSHGTRSVGGYHGSHGTRSVGGYHGGHGARSIGGYGGHSRDYRGHGGYPKGHGGHPGSYYRGYWPHYYGHYYRYYPSFAFHYGYYPSYGFYGGLGGYYPYYAYTPPRYNVDVYYAGEDQAPSGTGASGAESGSGALEYQRRAEEAFRLGKYGEAVRELGHALVETPRDGRLHLFLSQALFAVGDYRPAAAAIHQGVSLLEPSDWGYVVANFRRYYGNDDYAKQMKLLAKYIEENPDAAHARFLRGYHWGFLGHLDIARRDLAKAIELESRDKLAASLLERFGGKKISPPSPPVPEGAPAEPKAEQ